MNCQATNVDLVADFVRPTTDVSGSIEAKWSCKKGTTETLVLSRLHISGYTRIRSCVVLDSRANETLKS